MFFVARLLFSLCQFNGISFVEPDFCVTVCALIFPQFICNFLCSSTLFLPLLHTTHWFSAHQFKSLLNVSIYQRHWIPINVENVVFFSLSSSNRCRILNFINLKWKIIRGMFSSCNILQIAWECFALLLKCDYLWC